MPDLHGCVALVTGGARRLGRAMAEALTADGATVAVHAHASATDPRFQADLRDAAAAQALPGRVVDAFGRLDIVVHSAAIMQRMPFGDVTPDDWNRVLDLNLRSGFFLAQGAADALRSARGALVLIADASGVDPWPSYLPHSVSKAGVIHLARGLAQVLAPEVRVNAIVPGSVLPPDDTSERELQRLADRSLVKHLGSPDDVVAALRFLLGTDYATGTVVTVDGGALVRPRADG